MNAGTLLAVAPAMGAKGFTTLDAWQFSRDLQALTGAWRQRSAFATDRILCDQLQDSTAASPRHIAEGYGRSSAVEYAQLLRFALGTLAETRNHLNDARNRGYITEDERQRGDHLARRAICATCGLRSALLAPARQPAVDAPRAWAWIISAIAPTCVSSGLLPDAHRDEERLLSCWRWIRCSSRM